MRETGLSSRRNNLRICRQNKPNVNSGSAQVPGHGVSGVELDQAGAEQGLRAVEREVHRQARAEEDDAGV